MGVILEAVLYDEGGNRQGRGIIELTHEVETKAGPAKETFRGTFLAIEDGYYKWWVGDHFKEELVTFQLCSKPASGCRVATPYRDPIHVDVFRVLGGHSARKVVWPDEGEKEKVCEALTRLDSGAHGSGPLGLPGGGEATGAQGSKGDEGVKSGAEGIEGLARALGAQTTAEKAKTDEEPPEKRRKKDEKEKAAGSDKDDLEKTLKGWAPAPVEGSALRLSVDKKKKKKKDKKTHESTESSSESSSTDSLFA